LITVRGLDLLRTADVIAYDRLVHPDLLKEASHMVEMIYVGKAPGRQAYSQEEINDLLISRGRSGKAVVRLKGGDPFVFGRGAEEAEALRRAGVRFEIIPGVSSALAAPAYAGIPVTYRSVARSFAVVTGHTNNPSEEPDWASQPAIDTLVILMGLGRIGAIAESLVLGGRSPDTPVAVIQSATTPDQKVVTGDLSNIASRAEGLNPPAVIVVGEVVRLHERIDWSTVVSASHDPNVDNPLVDLTRELEVATT
jgi:uroporphyrin-III C-methyltransferase